MVVTIPCYGAAYPFLQLYLWVVAQFLDGGSDVAAPVALSQDMILVVVEGCYFAGKPSPKLTAASHDAQQP